MSRKIEQKGRVTISDAGKKSEERDEVLAAGKAQLLSEIESLKVLISQLQQKSSTITFKDLEIPVKNFFKTQYYPEPLDVEVITKNELCSYSGLFCKKLGAEFIFAIQSPSTDGSKFKNDYWVQFFNNEDTWQLGRWVMPGLIDVRDIFKKYNFETATDIKYFLRECKHQIDVYSRRKQQFTDLEVFLSHLKRQGCCVESNYAYTRIIVKLVKANCESPTESRNILLYLFYKATETLPCKFSADCEGETELSADETERLKSLFKSFKKFELQIAAEKVLKSQESPFLWKEATLDDNLCEIQELEESEEEDDMETSFSKIFKATLKNRKKRGRDENYNEEESQINEGEQENKKSKNGQKSSAVVKKSTEKGATRKAPKAPKKNKAPALKNSTEPKEDKKEKIVKSFAKVKFTKIPPKLSQTPEKLEKRVSDIFKMKKSRGIVKNNSPLESEKFSRDKIKKINGDINRTAINPRRFPGAPQCSTPIAGCPAILSSTERENISAILREDTINANKIIDHTKMQLTTATPLLSIEESESGESDDKEFGGDDENQRALLEDLQAVKYKNPPRPKSTKRKTKAPVTGRNKIAKK